jgi:hypothetical protein
MEVRKAEVAGSFYPDDPEELQAELKRLLEAVPQRPLCDRLKALIVPHAGYRYSGPVAAVGYSQLKGLELLGQPKILLLGPAHYVAFSGAATHPADLWETPLGHVPALNPGVPLSDEGPLISLAEAHRMEHCLEVQLPFLQFTFKRFSIFPLVTGLIGHVELAKQLLGAIERFELVIVSSDLSHYHNYEQAREIDAVANRVIPALDIEGAERRLEACGKTAVLTLMLIAKELGWKGELLDYRNSGDITGERDQVVGYGCYGFHA